MTDETTRSEAALKPCPFCGGEAEIIDVTEPSNVGGKVAQCNQCETSTRVWFPIKDSVDRILMDAWNRRQGNGDGHIIVAVEQLLQESHRIESATPNLEDTYMRGRRSALKQVLELAKNQGTGEVHWGGYQLTWGDEG